MPPIDGRRVALVIGNSDYPDDGVWDRLPNAVNDAEFIAETLGDPARGPARFEVELVTNGSREEILRTLAAFAQRAAGADIALVYFSGHGFEYNLDNYIVPADASDSLVEGGVEATYINMSQVVRAAEARGFSLFFLDACRTRAPVLRWSNRTGGDRAAMFGAINAPQSAVFYATAMGNAAYDDAPVGSRLSPFAAAVGRGVTAPGLDLPYVFSSVREQVVSATRDRPAVQIPQLSGSWSRPFYFVPPATLASLSSAAEADAPSAPAPPPVVADRLDISLTTLSTIDEPILITRVLGDHSPADMIRMAEAGDPLALYLVGYMFEFGVGVEQDLAHARAWLNRAARTGHPAGQLELAYFLMMHRPNAEERALALDLLRRASGQGYAKAKSHLASALLSGILGAADRAEALRLYREAGALGHAYALYALALLGESAQSIAALESLARSGNDEGHNWLCEIAAAGLPVQSSFSHCRSAAVAGYAGARAHTALMYHIGQGVEASPSGAAYWARMAFPAHDLSDAMRRRLEPLLN